MDTKTLRRSYMGLMPKLNKALEHVNEQLADLPPSDFSLETGLKPYPSIKRKMEHDNIRDPAELSDLARGRIFFSSDYNHKELLDIIHKLFGSKIKNVDKNANSEKEHGLEYKSIIHVNLGIDGINFELQLIPEEFKPYKEFLHNIYDQFRNPKTCDKMSDKQKEFLRKTHNTIYKKIDEKAQSSRQH